ncbi:hypothetical protein D3C72_1995680 [compost metagenome]
MVAPGNLPEPLAQQAAEQFKLQRSTQASEALQQLWLGKVDYLLLERHSGAALVERLGMAADLQPLEPALGSEPLFLALSHNSACNDPWLRGKLARQMTEFRTAGLPQTLLQRNLERWKAQRPETVTP